MDFGDIWVPGEPQANDFRVNPDVRFPGGLVFAGTGSPFDLETTEMVPLGENWVFTGSSTEIQTVF